MYINNKWLISFLIVISTIFIIPCELKANHTAIKELDKSYIKRYRSACIKPKSYLGKLSSSYRLTTDFNLFSSSPLIYEIDIDKSDDVLGHFKADITDLANNQMVMDGSIYLNYNTVEIELPFLLPARANGSLIAVSGTITCIGTINASSSIIGTCGTIKLLQAEDIPPGETLTPGLYSLANVFTAVPNYKPNIRK